MGRGGEGGEEGRQRNLGRDITMSDDEGQQMKVRLMEEGRKQGKQGRTTERERE